MFLTTSCTFKGAAIVQKLELNSCKVRIAWIAPEGPSATNKRHFLIKQIKMGSLFPQFTSPEPSCQRIRAGSSISWEDYKQPPG